MRAVCSGGRQVCGAASFFLLVRVLVMAAVQRVALCHRGDGVTVAAPLVCFCCALFNHLGAGPCFLVLISGFTVFKICICFVFNVYIKHKTLYVEYLVKKFP